MKEKLEKIRDVAREMLMRPGGADSVEWRCIWHLACNALDELKESDEREGQSATDNRPVTGLSVHRSLFGLDG